MSEKRQFKRHRRRLNVRFGERDFSMTGLTYDVSATGLFLVTNQVLAVRTRLHVQMFLDTQRFVCFEAEVRRQKIVPVNLRSVEKGGMGLRLLTPTELMRDTLDQGRLRVTVTFPSVEAFQASYDRELRTGTMLLRAARPLPRATKLMVEIVLPFAPATLELEAMVGPHVPPGTPEGTVQILFEAKDVPQQLAVYLPKP